MTYIYRNGVSNIANHIIELVEPDAVNFMKGFQSLSQCEKKIVTYLLSQDGKKFFGTNVELCDELGNKYSYNSEVSLALKRLNDIQVIVLHEPVKWYNREVELSENWINALVQIGEEKV